MLAHLDPAIHQNNANALAANMQTNKIRDGFFAKARAGSGQKPFKLAVELHENLQTDVSFRRKLLI